MKARVIFSDTLENKESLIFKPITTISLSTQETFINDVTMRNETGKPYAVILDKDGDIAGQFSVNRITAPVLFNELKRRLEKGHAVH